MKLSLGLKAVAFTGVVVAWSTASVIAVCSWVLSDQFLAKARADANVNLRTLALTYADANPEAKITIEAGAVRRVEASAMPAFSDHKVVDRAVAAVGGTATIFVQDTATEQFVRRTTNLTNENGERAIGTALAADHPAQALLRRGTPYNGPAVLFGRRFYTAYQPVVDAAGRTVGVLYVGMPIEHYDAMLSQAMTSTASVAAAGALIILLATAVVARRALRPLASITSTLTRLAEGDLDIEIGHRHRTDEIGDIARHVESLREAARRRRRLDEEERQRLQKASGPRFCARRQRSSRAGSRAR